MRLIDADTFIEYLGLDVENAREENLGEVVSLEDFDRQPTAYKVDKAVEWLIANAMFVQEYAEPLIFLDDAIEIAKSGGIEEEKGERE